jgi:hypothetical protein
MFLLAQIQKMSNKRIGDCLTSPNTSRQEKAPKRIGDCSRSSNTSRQEKAPKISGQFDTGAVSIPETSECCSIRFCRSFVFLVVIIYTVLLY